MNPYERLSDEEEEEEKGNTVIADFTELVSNVMILFDQCMAKNLRATGLCKLLI